MKVVFDTNVYISAFLFPGGVCEQIINIVRGGGIDVFVSPDILTELKRVFVDKFELSDEEANTGIDRVLAFAKLIYPRFRIDKIKKPEADNRILECAVEATAVFLVTGDKKHILPLKKYDGVNIISPSEFLEIIEKIIFLK